MLSMNATDVRKNWSEVADSVIRTKPKFIKKTRDYMFLSNIQFLDLLLADVSYNAKTYIEADGSVTISLDELCLVENAETEKEALLCMANSILEYSLDFYNDFQIWSIAPNKKAEIPYVFKALILDDVDKIKENIKCQPGKN